MEWECRKCGAENVTEDFPFSDDVICAECGAVHETDWDYIDEDSMAAWVVGLRRTPPAEEPTP